jgi:hypothetical protein
MTTEIIRLINYKYVFKYVYFVIDGLFFRTNIFEILIIYLGIFLETYTCIILVRKNINPRSPVNKHTSKHTSKHTWKHIYIWYLKHICIYSCKFKRRTFISLSVKIIISCHIFNIYDSKLVLIFIWCLRSIYITLIFNKNFIHLSNCIYTRDLTRTFMI